MVSINSLYSGIRQYTSKNIDQKKRYSDMYHHEHSSQKRESQDVENTNQVTKTTHSATVDHQCMFHNIQRLHGGRHSYKTSADETAMSASCVDGVSNIETMNALKNPNIAANSPIDACWGMIVILTYINKLLITKWEILLIVPKNVAMNVRIIIGYPIVLFV